MTSEFTVIALLSFQRVMQTSCSSSNLYSYRFRALFSTHFLSCSGHFSVQLFCIVQYAKRPFFQISQQIKQSEKIFKIYEIVAVSLMWNKFLQTTQLTRPFIDLADRTSRQNGRNEMNNCFVFVPICSSLNLK